MIADGRPIAVVTPLFPELTGPAPSHRGIFIYNIVRSLSRLAPIEVFWLVPAYPGTSRRIERIDSKYPELRVPVSSVPYAHLPLLFQPWTGHSSARALQSALRDRNPSVVLAYWTYPTGFGAIRAARQLGIPVVLGALGSDLLKIPNRFVERRTRTALREAHFLLTVSDDLRNKAVALGARPERIRTVQNGVDHEIFNPTDRNASRRVLGVPLDARLVLFVGWLSRMKGAPDLIAAARTLLLRHPKLEFCLIGTGDLERELRCQIKQAGIENRIRMPGRKTSQEIATWIAACDVFALPSYSEGCPNVVLEALACGRPVVAYSAGGIPELVNRETGIIVPVGDCDALAAALSAALAKEWPPAFIASGYRRSWDDVAIETLNIVHAVVKQHSVSP